LAIYDTRYQKKVEALALANGDSFRNFSMVVNALYRSIPSSPYSNEIGADLEKRPIFMDEYKSMEQEQEECVC
jgi:hypothetical protein